MIEYRPILRWKQGEQIALRETFDENKSICIPLLQLSAHEYNPVAGQIVDPAFDRRIEQDANTINSAWADHRISVEFGVQDFDRICEGNRYPSDYFFDCLQGGNNGIADISPVVRLGNVTVLTDNICRICRERALKPTIRLTPDDIADISEGDLEQIAEACATDFGQIDLVLDLEFIESEKRARFTALGALAALPFIDDWKSITISAGSFPESLSQFSVGDHLIPRYEWGLFTSVREITRRRLSYGDYATIYPLRPESEIDPLTMNASASVRYTVDENWLLMRGHGTRTAGRGGFDQFIDHAKRLVLMPEYRGEDFSNGDWQIMQIAEEVQSKGNLRTWVTIGINHHIAEIVYQLANIDDA